MPQTMNTSSFVAPEARITPDMYQRLEQLAPLFHLHLERVQVGDAFQVQFSGAGFSETEPLLLSQEDAKVRLLAEICSILARWIPFSVWESCEVTLFALAPERIQRCANSFRKQIAQQTRAADKAAATRVAADAISRLK